MAKAIDAAQFTRQVTSRAIEHLTSLAPLARINEGALVRIKMAGAGGHSQFVQGYVVSHTGTGIDEALKIRSGRQGHFRMLAVPLNSPELLGVEIMGDFGSHRHAAKTHGYGKGKPTKAKKSGAPFAEGWHHRRNKARLYYTRNQAIADVVEQAVAETVAADQAVIIGGLEPVTIALAERLSAMVGNIRDASSNDRIEKLVELMLPVTDPVSEVRAKIEVDNAALRLRFLSEVPALTAAQIAEAAGSKASNKSATANRWKSAGQIFSVSQAGRETFPAFQFDHGEPRPIIGKLLAVLQPRNSAWETAFWFVSSNPWLDGDAPIDRLDEEGALMDAAQRAAEGLPT